MVMAFLLLAVCHHAIPGLCSAESFAVSGSGRTASRWAAPATPSAPVNPLPGEGDCFCCCPHIVPAPFVQVPAGLATLTETPRAAEEQIPDLPPQTIFHPPKQ